jgi:hypothetical protein
VAKQSRSLDLNWAQAGGSALAALSSAVLLSTLGATGTMVGAAVGSVVVTVGGTIYSHYLSLSRERMAAARSAAVGASRVRRSPRLTPTRASVQVVARTVTQSPERYPLLAASAQGAAPPGRGDDVLPRTSHRERLRGLRWKPALATSLGLFLLVMGLIVSMELATGRALSSYTGGSGADGPRTSISLLGSTTEGTRDPGTTDPSDRADRTDDRTSDGRSGDTPGSAAGARRADDTDAGSTGGPASEPDASQPDTSPTDPGSGTSPAPEPEPTPDTSPEPIPDAPTEPAPAPTAQDPAAQAPAPSTGSAVGGSAAGPAS